MIAAALILAQAIAAPASASPTRFLILADPCAPSKDDAGRDVVVCGQREAASPRLPLVAVRGAPSHPVPSNPEMIAGGARLSAADLARECGVYGEDCYGYSAGSILPVLVDGIGSAAYKVFGRKPDKRGRVLIDLDAPPAPIPPGAIRP